jgi:glycosyltransferase involved in cell wall biosynthesis
LTHAQRWFTLKGRKGSKNLSTEIESSINASPSSSRSAGGNQQSAFRLRVEGPFDSSYSLAIVNREFALALHGLGFDVTLHSTEGPGDFSPSKRFLENNDLARKLYEKSLYPATPLSNVTTRNMYPPRVNDYSGGWSSIHNYAWEESNFPAEWVFAFNEHVDFIACASTHTRRVLNNCGVSVPTVSLGYGIDHWDRHPLEPYELDSQKRFRFLHVSSGFPRKGTNLLIEAFLREFTADDDVSLTWETQGSI